MNRRTFTKLLGTGALAGMQGIDFASPAPAITPQSSTSLPPWPSQTYRRFLVDMHVPDWSPDLLSHFDAVDYVRTIADAGFQSLMHYANSHVGLCYWRTKIGRMHANMKDHDFFGEVVAECRRRGLHIVAYFTLIFDNWNFERHPDWRILPEQGYDPTLEGRYGVVCPNSPYREYALACVREIAANYDIDGMFLDMTFWPAVCYCPHCTARYWKEFNDEPPRLVNWDDPAWRQFQKARQRWLLEFAQEVTKTIKQARPIPAYHQYSTIYLDWSYGVPLELNTASDFAGGDFYRGPTQYSLICKTYDGLTQKHPYEFMTSVSRDLRSRVSLKTMDELKLESSIPTLHSAALLLIDGINPDGSLHKPLYEMLAKLNAMRAPYEPYLGGDLLADVAIYYDRESMYNPSEQGVRIDQLKATDHCPHRNAVIGMAGILRKAHIPFSVITDVNLFDMGRFRAIVLPNVLELTPEQAELFRRFVDQGGILYASAPSSLDRFDKSGPRLLLEDVLGVRYAGTLGTQVTYLTPTHSDLKQAASPQSQIYFPGSMMKVEALPGTEVLANVTLPFAPLESGHAIGSHFADIHSSQPALAAESSPAMVQHSHGKGKSIWLAASLESSTDEVNARIVLAALRRALPGPFHFEADTHPSVEMTLFHQPDKKRLLAGLLNMSQELPPIPVRATVRVQVPNGRKARRVISVPDGRTILFERNGAYTQFHVEGVEVLSMATVEYE